MQLFPIRDLRRLVRLGQFRGRLFGLALGLALLETWFSLWVPLLTRDLIEGEGIRTPLLVRMALALVAQALAAGLCHFVLGVLGANLVYNIRRVLTQHMLRLPVPFFDQHRSGELVSRVVADTDNLKSVLADHLVPFLSGLVLMLGSIVVLGYLDWKMTMVLLAAVLIAFIAMVPVAVQLNRIGKDTQSAAAQFSGRLTEVFREIRLVKAYNAVHMEGQKAAEGVGQLRNWGIQTAKVQALMSPLVSIVLMGAMVVILGYGALRVQQGSLALGEWVAFLFYLFHIVVPMVQFSVFYGEIQTASGAVERICQFLDLPGETQPEEIQTVKPKGDLVFDQVHFQYADQAVLSDVSLTVPSGKITALVGPSGAGKTTLFHLISRFYSSQSGKLRCGDQDIADIELHTWRSQLGLVPQEAPLLSGSVRENLCYGSDRAVSDKELWAVLEAAHADFVRDLPHGLDSPVGERGLSLSGGQRQRLAIARALLRDPRFLLLDEATSQLDAESEHHVQAALSQIMQGRTTLVIAHRLTTVMHADQIVVLEKGKIMGIGTHQELLASNQRYRNLVEHQLQAEPCIT